MIPGSARSGRRRRAAGLLGAGVLALGLAGFAPAGAAEPPDSASRVHRMQPGETVWSLAQRYGVSVEAIIEANHIEDVRRVYAGRRIRIPGPASAEAPVPGPPARAPLEAARTGLEAAERALREARFEEALRAAEEAERALGSAGAGDVEARRLRAHLHVLRGTAEVALSRTGDALVSFEQALALDPTLDLDGQATSPKVLRVFRAARARRAPVTGGR